MTVRWIEDNRFNRALPLWTRAYVADLAPGPLTPLGWDLVWEGAAALGWRDALVDRMAFAPSEIDLDRPELIGVIGGYAYLNVSLLRVWAARVPGMAPGHVEAAYLGGLAGLPDYEAEPWHELPAGARSQLLKWLGWVLVDQNQNELEAGRQLSLEARAKRPDFAGLSDNGVVDYALSLKPLCRALVSQHANQVLAASIGPNIIAAICAEIDSPTVGTQLLAGLGGLDTLAPLPALATLAQLVGSSGLLTEVFDGGVSGLWRRLCQLEAPDAVGFVAGLEAVVAEVGFRGSGEWELAGPTWETEPECLLMAIDMLRHQGGTSPGARLARTATERASLVSDVAKVVAADPVTRDQFGAAVLATEVFLRGRDRSRTNVSRVVHEMRMAMRELGERAFTRGDLSDPEDVHMLFTDELVYYADGGLAKVKEIADERRSHLRWLANLVPPVVVAGAISGNDDWPARTPVGGGRLDLLGPGDVLLGRPGCAGVGRGRARALASPRDAHRLRIGDVLVVSMFEPGWAPLLPGLSAVVADGGGPLSHATVVARELGVPCVVATGDATTVIPDGALVEVDGLAGVVSVGEVPDVTPAPADSTTDPWGSRAY